MTHHNTTTDERNAAELWRPRRTKVEIDPALPVVVLDAMLRGAGLTLVDHGSYYLLTRALPQSPASPPVDSIAERARRAMLDAGID